MSTICSIIQYTVIYRIVESANRVLVDHVSPNPMGLGESKTFCELVFCEYKSHGLFRTLPCIMEARSLNHTMLKHDQYNHAD